MRLTATGYQVHERIIDFRLFHSRMIRPAGRGPNLPETKLVSPSDDPPRRGGRTPGSQANGSFPKGTGRLSEKSPAGYPPPHHGDAPPGSAGVPPACCPLGCRSVSLRCCSRPPCRREPHGPGRSRGRAPLPVEPGGGDGKGCAKTCAGGTPALPGGLPPMTGSHQRDKSAEAFWRQLSLKEVHQSSCLKQNLFHSCMIRPAGRGPTTSELSWPTRKKLPSSSRCTGWRARFLPGGC